MEERNIFFSPHKSPRRLLLIMSMHVVGAICFCKKEDWRLF